MSRITLTKKRNGRYYLGMDDVDFRVLRDLIINAKCPCYDRALGVLSVEESKLRLAAAVEKPARGEEQ